MTRPLLKVGLMALAFALVSAPAFAQGGATSSIVGVVTDSGGGVIPGATVTATNDATAGTYTAVTNANGDFTIPALNVGKYTVTVALQGFKTAVLKDVEVTVSTPANVKAVLEVGGLTETVVVEGASAVIQTQASAAASTVTTNQIANLPVTSRSTLEFVTFLPGVQTPGGSRDSIVNGLPQSSISHHARWRQHPGQPPEDDGRVLRAVEPAARRGRGSDADVGRQRRERVGPGRDADSVHDPLGQQHVLGQRLLLLPARLAQLEQLLQHTARPAEERIGAASAGHPGRRSDRAAEASTTAAARRFSS